ncbi:MAG: hypothetical protein ACU85U_05285 [Gammaproteobacteria bacterium]|jgi:hypothetical protein
MGSQGPTLSDCGAIAKRRCGFGRCGHCADAADDFTARQQFFDDGEIVETVAAISLFGYLNRRNDTLATELKDLPVKVATRTLGPAGTPAGTLEDRR